MTVSTEVTRVIVEGNSIATSFAYSFPIPGSTSTDQTNAELILTGTNGLSTTLANNLWSITGIITDSITSTNPGGGNFVYSPGTPIAAGNFLTLNRIVPFTQPTELGSQGAYSPTVVMNALDWLALQTEQLNTRMLQTVHAPITDDALADLPSAVNRANSFLYFDANGDPTTASSTGGMPSSIFIGNTASTTTYLTQTLLLAGASLSNVGSETTASFVLSGGTITVTDGTHTGSNVTTINFTGTGAVVTTTSGPIVNVAVAGGGGGGGGGGLVYLATSTASGGTSIDLTTGFSDTYDNYLVLLSGVRAGTGTSNLTFQISHDGGSTWLGSSNFSWDLYSYTVGSVTGSAASGVAAAVIATNLSSNSSFTVSGQINFNDLRSTRYKETAGTLVGLDSTIALQKWESDSLSQDNTNKTNGIRFIMSSGTISGTAQLYGYAQA